MHLHHNYDSSNNENKFIVGGAVEIFFCCLLNAINIDCIHSGVSEVDYDLLINNYKFSIKFNGNKPYAVRLINYRGKQETVRFFRDPTIFITGGIGIGYVDPSQTINNSNIFKADTDGSNIKYSWLQQFWKENSDYLFKHLIITKEKADATKKIKSRVPSVDIAKLLINDYSKYLREYIK